MTVSASSTSDLLPIFPRSAITTATAKPIRLYIAPEFGMFQAARRDFLPFNSVSHPTFRRRLIMTAMAKPILLFSAAAFGICLIRRQVSILYSSVFQTTSLFKQHSSNKILPLV